METLLSRYEINRELLRGGPYMCHQYQHVTLHFLPGGVLRVYGEAKAPIAHTWTLIHRDNKWFMTTSPHLLNEPAEMEVFMMTNHMTLKSTLLDEAGNPKEVLNFTKHKIKAY